MFVHAWKHVCVAVLICGGPTICICLDAKWKQKLTSAESMCEDLLAQIQSRKHKNTAIIYIMQKVSASTTGLVRPSWIALMCSHSNLYCYVPYVLYSPQLSRVLNAARVTSCKSAKDRTSMAVTLEQANILVKEYNMEQSVFQQALDSMRRWGKGFACAFVSILTSCLLFLCSQGTRLQNCMKNVGHPLYAFNVIQVTALPRNFRPPDGTYRKLPT